jgi:hypothetical protein
MLALTASLDAVVRRSAETVRVARPWSSAQGGALLGLAYGGRKKALPYSGADQGA